MSIFKSLAIVAMLSISLLEGVTAASACMGNACGTEGESGSPSTDGK